MLARLLMLLVEYNKYSRRYAL